jgi:proteasome lid subunit RPN8/RPN11
MSGESGGIVIGPEERAEMERAARHAYPEECCGILLGTAAGGRRTVTAVRPIRNARRDAARNRYLITGSEMLEAEKEARRSGTSIVGYFHSHPDVPPIPSITDLKDATWPNTSYVILSVREGSVDEMRSWTLAEDRERMNEEPIL